MRRYPGRCTAIVVALALAVCVALVACVALAAAPATRPSAVAASTAPYAIVLGIAQDGGCPQAGCKKPCCERVWRDPTLRRRVACLAIVDPVSGERWMFDATPDFATQLHDLDAAAPVAGASPGLNGIFLTHAHIGHYTGLMQLGREVIGARGVPVYALPRLRQYLTDNGPWGQLVELGNVRLLELVAGTRVVLSPRLAVTPFRVPHRDEYSETVGFEIEGPEHKLAWIPDIDKWDQWETRLEALLDKVDVAYVDGTFYAAGELPGRDMSEIPHPFIQETLQRLAPLATDRRSKVRFVHLNHTNPALVPDGEAQRAIEAAGCRVAAELERCPL